MADMLAMLLLTTLTASPPEGMVVERIVAVVRNPAGSQARPLTLTRLTEEARVALVAQGALEAATAPLDAAALRAALHWLVDQLLVVDEAARLQVDEVSRDEVEAAVHRFEQRFRTEADYRAFLKAADLAEQDLAVALERDLKVQRYLASRVGRGARVSDEEVSRALAGQGATPEAPGAREAVRSRLLAERAEAHVRQLMADLRARADVRVLVPELREAPAR
jgi:hypothetical protein